MNASYSDTLPFNVLETETPPDSQIAIGMVVDLRREIEKRYFKKSIYWKVFSFAFMFFLFLTIWLLSLKWDDTLSLIYADSMRLNKTITTLESSLTNSFESQVKLSHLQHEVHAFMVNTSGNGYGHDKVRLESALAFSKGEKNEDLKFNVTSGYSEVR